MIMSLTFYIAIISEILYNYNEKWFVPVTPTDMNLAELLSDGENISKT